MSKVKNGTYGLATQGRRNSLSVEPCMSTYCLLTIFATSFSLLPLSIMIRVKCLNLPLGIKLKKMWENQDGGIGRHTVPPRTTRTDRKSNGKEV